MQSFLHREALSIRVPLNRLPRLINRQVVDLQRRGNPLIVEKHQTLDTLLSSDSDTLLMTSDSDTLVWIGNPQYTNSEFMMAPTTISLRRSPP